MGTIATANDGTPLPTIDALVDYLCIDVNCGFWDKAIEDCEELIAIFRNEIANDRTRG